METKVQFLFMMASQEVTEAQAALAQALQDFAARLNRAAQSLQANGTEPSEMMSELSKVQTLQERYAVAVAKKTGLEDILKMLQAH